ncbi:MAG: UDP-N-acetyl glucosamine 2-epimerase, partial [Acidimicrobiales bacterium]
EVNRVVADRLANLLFAPSPDAVENLRAEGFDEARIHLVGNVMIDTLLACAARALARPILDELGLHPGGYGLVTLHRPANVDHPPVLAGLVGALNALSARLPLVFPAHPRTAAKLDAHPLAAGLRVIEPVGYLDSVALQAGARLVLTDSGGLQEETTALGVPCLTLRENTERPITVTEGTNRVVGVEPRAIAAAAADVLDHGVERRRPALWDGKASERIADVLEAALAGEVIDLRPAPSPVHP